MTRKIMVGLVIIFVTVWWYIATHQQSIFVDNYQLVAEQPQMQEQYLVEEKTSKPEEIIIHQEPVTDTTNEVQTQGMIFDIAVDMGAMMLAQEGASMANEHITAQGGLLSAKIAKNSQTIQNNMQGFQSKAQASQQKQLEAMMNAFSDAQKNVQAKMQQAAAISGLELDYLYKNLSIDQPQQNYIFNQIQFDQLYSLGTMLTPQGAVWKNPFSVGDWEYEKSTNSFWQYQNAPLANKTTDDAGKVTSSSLQAENNAIYAEYFTTATNYTIAGSITLNSISSQFFAGVMFNKARWVSGDFEAIRKCRMIGIYGASNSDIGIYFAQQYTMTDDQMKANPNDDPIQTPLQQIINNKVAKKIALPANAFADLQKNPVTFNYEITNTPTAVTLKLWSGNNSPVNITINNLDPAVYMYHGIGFISPGATAEFKLSQPQDFIFTQQAISNYKE